MKYAWINSQREWFPLPEMCRVLDVSISGYRAWLGGGTSGSMRLSDGQAVVVINVPSSEAVL